MTDATAGRSGSAGTPLISMRNIHKKFGSLHALRGASLDVHAGELVALVGDNGAGKSTMVKVMAGVHAATSGSYEFEGKPVKISSPTDANDLGIQTVYQDLALCSNLDAVQNLFLGRELTGLGLFGRRIRRS
jgi:simple sugar transport system ATP-binding protein/D-xylose transport system ATP-binding protein